MGQCSSIWGPLAPSAQSVGGDVLQWHCRDLCHNGDVVGGGFLGSLISLWFGTKGVCWVLEGLTEPGQSLFRVLPKAK